MFPHLSNTTQLIREGKDHKVSSNGGVISDSNKGRRGGKLKSGGDSRRAATCSEGTHAVGRKKSKKCKWSGKERI